MIDMENKLYIFDREKGEKIIGIDEAGRGPLAGEVVASAVILHTYSEKLDKINDSKKISEKKREELFDIIKEHFFVGIGIATVEEIDSLNILNATFLAMRRAIENLNVENKEYLVLVDGNFKIREYNHSQEPIIKGDATSLSIAAASIIAKVTRDKMMMEIAKNYPEYHFEKHKGYGTKLHKEALLKYGATDIHRKTFLKKILGSNLETDEK